MSWTIADLIGLKKSRPKEHFVVGEIDVEKPVHALCHFPFNRIITLSKYKETVKLLSNLEHLKPFSNLQEYCTQDIWLKLKDQLDNNTMFTYNIRLEYLSKIRFTTEDYCKIWDYTTLAQQEVFTDQTMTLNQIIEFRIKSAALDFLFDRINWARSSMHSDIILDDYIRTQTYRDALEHIASNKQSDLLKIAAIEWNTSISEVAKLICFIYEEKQHTLLLTEQFKIFYQNQILRAESADEIRKLTLDIQTKSKYQL